MDVPALLEVDVLGQAGVLGILAGSAHPATSFYTNSISSCCTAGVPTSAWSMAACVVQIRPPAPKTYGILSSCNVRIKRVRCLMPSHSCS